MNRLKLILLTVSTVLAMAFIFSCSDDSSKPQYLFCVYPFEEICVPGPVAECQSGGLPKDECPNDFSKGSGVLSSSSTEGVKKSSSSGGSNPSLNISSSSGIGGGNSSSSIPSSGSSSSNLNHSSSSDIGGGNSSSSIPSSGSSSSSSVVSVGCPSYNSATHFCDSRDGKVYKWVEIGEQVWMAENLKHIASDSKCSTVLIGDRAALSDDDTEACDKYGRLYDWATAMALPASCNTTSCVARISTKHKGICPAGWHIPSNEEFNVLRNFVGECKYLKVEEWRDGYDGYGEDKYGFAALPGGYVRGQGISAAADSVGYLGYWWNSNEDSYAYSLSPVLKISFEGYCESSTISKKCLVSVRCVKDD